MTAAHIKTWQERGNWPEDFTPGYDGLPAWEAAKAEIADLRAALAAQPSAVVAGMEWQPIETAPKDIAWKSDRHSYGPYILVWDGTNVLRAHWWFHDDGGCNFLAASGGYAIHPTHWMPLPAAPSIDAARADKEKQ